MAKRQRKACLELSMRRSKLVVSVLMLMSAILVTVGSLGNTLPPVQAAPTITLTPTFAPRGALVTFTGSGFLTTNTACSVGLRDVFAANQTVPTQPCTMS